MPITPDQIRQAATEATASFNRGNLARADLICQSVLAQDVRPAEILLILGQVAAAIGEHDVARRCFQEIGDRAQLARLDETEAPPCRSEANTARFHLIKAWGFGFAADVDHTLGHLLLAEMTGRTPVIHWGTNSLFRDADAENAWTDFFEAVSPHHARDLARADFSFFPAKWSAGNLMSEEINKISGPGSRTAGFRFLNQGASVTVGDFFTSVIELLPWVRPPHPLAPSGPVKAPAVEAAYRYLVDRYLKPRLEIVAEVDAFAAANFAGQQMLAVHVRGTDKAGETANLPEGQRRIFQMVRAELAANPRLKIFLLTDEQQIRLLYANAFGPRVVTTDCQRSDTRHGVHYLPSANRRLLGIEVVRDMFMAARCDALLGLGCTNVSSLILHLKPWPPGAARLLGPVLHYQRNLVLHG